MSFITWDEVLTRYKSLADYPQTSAQQVSYIEFGESEINGRLATCFVVPFSSNNTTARDLAIDVTFANTIKFSDEEKYTAIMDHIEKITEGLKSKKQGMILDTGDVVYADRSIGGIGTVSSTTENYPPPFFMGDHIDMQVSSAQLEDEYDARFQQP